MTDSPFMSGLSGPTMRAMSSHDIRTDDSDSNRRKPSNTPGAKRRPSRAGTRSVTTLTAAQLERKRANDREAQRAIRQRTKDHIEALERRIAELTEDTDTSKLSDALRKIDDLQHENSILRSRQGQFNPGSSYGLDTSASSGMATDGSLLSAAQSPGAAMLHGQRTSPTSTVASIPSQHSTVSQAESWSAHARGFSPGASTPIEAPGSAVDVSAPEMSWNVPSNAAAHHVSAQASPMAAHDIDPTVANQMGYYVVYTADGRPTGYQPNTSMSQRTPPPSTAASAPVAHQHAMSQQAEYRPTTHLPSQMGPQQQAPYSPFHEQPAYMSGEGMQMMGRPQGQHLIEVAY